MENEKKNRGQKYASDSGSSSVRSGHQTQSVRASPKRQEAINASREHSYGCLSVLSQKKQTNKKYIYIYK